MPRLIRGHRLSRDGGDRSHDVASGESAVASTSRTPLVANSSTKESSVGRALIDEGQRSLSIDRGSPSPMNRERSSSKRQELSSSAVPPSPPAMASDMSTSGESDLELDGETTQAGRSNISIVDEHADGDDDEEMNEGGVGAAALDDGSPEVKCMWEDCGVIFNSLAPFINHLHEEHVGIHKNRYACEWTGCPRKGKGQTSRFALLSHLRSHTGEKPFTCPRPECDKSFTRSDALAKHMRVQHNINPVTSRTKNTAVGATMPGGRGGRRGDGEEEDWIALGLEGEGAARAGSDIVGDELLELAEGEAGNGSLADIEQSLLMLDSKSPFFTYENVFGAGARALAHHARMSVNGKKGAANDASKIHVGPIPDAELGIERDTQYSVGLLLNDNVRDDEAISREENEMARSLEAGRREWVRRERENAEHRKEVEGGARRETIDYISDDDAEQADTSTRSSKRIRRSSMRNAPKPVPGVNDVGTLKRLYIVEKAKLRWIRKENEKMRVALADLRQVERQEMMEKRALLERTLEVELGKEVGAIFSPPGSPRG